MLPETIDIDRTLPDAGAIKPALRTYARGVFGDEAGVERLHRVFYPAFVVTYTYESTGRLSLTTDTNTGRALVDGLWADNHGPLQRYRPNLDEFVEVMLSEYDFGRDSPGFGRSIILDYQVATEQARELLPRRIADLDESRSHNDPESVRSTFESQIFDDFALPDDFDVSGFEGVDEVRPVYLPFWVAELYRPDDRDRIVAVRTHAEAESNPSDEHDWLGDFLTADRSRLAEYAHPFHEISESRTGTGDTDASSDDSTGDADASDIDETGSSTDASETDGRPTTDDPDTDGDEDTDSDAEGTSSESTRAMLEVVQPPDADLDAEALVEARPGRSFADVGGMADLERTIRRTVIDPVQRPAEFQRYGLDPVGGVLLHGPPGCGKTYVAGAIAGELEWPFVAVTPADLLSKYVGEPASNVQDLFAIAEANAPCVLFIDEIDAVAGAREDQSNSSERGMVNQLLTELETVPEGVLVLAATNALDAVDEAITRTGRFDERIEVPPPDADARREILRVHLEERPIAENLGLAPVVERTAGYAASDLAAIANAAARQALRDDEVIDGEHLLAAVADTESSVPDWAGGALDGGKTIEQPDGVSLNARSLVTAATGLDFADVGGMDDLKTRLRERIIAPIDASEDYEEYGIDPANGVLLHGPPGCGKSYLAQALAGELDRVFLDVTPADLTSKWMGKPAQNVADLFEIARANAPCTLFIDEIDGLAGSRAGGGPENTSQRQLVNQLLTELERAGEDDVVVLAATNLVDEVDDAILRSGRFDERIEVPPPDGAARREILEVQLRDRPVADVDWEPVLEATAGFAASDLALLAENAARRALQADEPVMGEHLLAAADDTPSSIDSWVSDAEAADDDSDQPIRWYD